MCIRDRATYDNVDAIAHVKGKITAGANSVTTITDVGNDGIDAVSYTHLDVYKRQDNSSA